MVIGHIGWSVQIAIGRSCRSVRMVIGPIGRSVQIAIGHIGRLLYAVPDGMGQSDPKRPEMVGTGS